MSSAPTGLRRRMSSRASLASLSVTSSISRCSSRRSLGDKCHKQRQDSLSSATAFQLGSSQGRSEKDSSSRPRVGDEAVETTSLITTATNHVLGLLFQIVCPELFTVLELCRAMVVRYRDNCILHQLHPFSSQSGTSFPSFGEPVVRNLETTRSSSLLRDRKLSSYRHDFLPWVELIECEHENEHWGHFADFECVEEDDAAFLAFRLNS